MLQLPEAPNVFTYLTFSLLPSHFSIKSFVLNLRTSSDSPHRSTKLIPLPITLIQWDNNRSLSILCHYMTFKSPIFISNSPSFIIFFPATSSLPAALPFLNFLALISISVLLAGLPSKKRILLAPSK